MNNFHTFKDILCLLNGLSASITTEGIPLTHRPKISIFNAFKFIYEVTSYKTAVKITTNIHVMLTFKTNFTPYYISIVSLEFINIPTTLLPFRSVHIVSC